MTGLKIYINDIEIGFSFLEVEIDKYSFYRNFEFQITEENQNYNLGDQIIIKDNNNNIILKGEIEFIFYQDYKYFYSGRNSIFNFIDSYTSEKIKFKKNTKIENIIKKIAEPFNINIKGNGNSLSKVEIVIEEGKQIGKIISKLCKLHFTKIYVNEENEIILNEEPTLENFIFEYQGNLKGAALEINKTYLFDKYTIIGINEKGEHGSGDKHKVKFYGLDITSSECQNIAKFLYTENKLFYYTYIISIDINNDSIFINKKYNVKDNIRNINKELIIKKIKYTSSTEEDNINIYLEDLD